MPNLEFKRVLDDFDIIVQRKILAFEATTDANLLQEFLTDFQTRRNQFKEPNLWRNEIVYQPRDFEIAFHRITVISPPNIRGLVREYMHCVNLINQTLQDSLTLHIVIGNPWNLRAFEALRRLEYKMMERTDSFLQQGINVHDDPDYLSVAKSLKIYRWNYKLGLREQTIQADGAHERILNNGTRAINNVSQLPGYIHILSRLAGFLQRYIPTP